jgi:hypothetical protein
MKRKRRSVRSALLACAALAAAAVPRIAHAQPDTTDAVHATLRWWDEQLWMTIFDRGGSFYGRTSDRGILQRFNETMDWEYHIDLLSYRFTLAEVARWYRNENGVRLWAGSIDHVRLVQWAQLKARVPLGGAWTAEAQLTQERTLQAERGLAWLRIARGVAGGRGRLFLRGTIKPDKPESDIELGTTWRLAGGTVTVALGALDLFSDFIYQSLGAPVNVADSALDYRTHPYTLRAAADLPLGRGFRVEGYALAMTPTRVVAESQTEPDVGFVQDERFAYAGALLEWAPTPATALGGFATGVRARTGRRPLAAGRPEDDYDLTERTWRLGLYAIHRFVDRLQAEAWLAHTWRTEDRARPDTTVAPNVDYEDRTWAGRLGLTYRARSGFTAELGFDFTVRDLVGRDRLPGAIEAGNSRLRFDLGWQVGRRALFLLGSNVDLDGDRGGATGAFDGGHGRFALYW